MRPVVARITVLTFLGIFAGITVNAVLLQDSRVAYFEPRERAGGVVVKLDKRATRDVSHVSSLKKPQDLDAKIRDVLQENNDHELVPEAGQPMVLRIQKRLSELGYYPGKHDGIAGPTTLAAIMAFEFDKGILQTGLADEEILKVMNGEKRMPARGIKPVLLVKNSQELVAALQTALSKLGYDTGRADGLIGPLTRKRIRAFERDHKLEVTGRISGRLVDRIAKARGRPLLLARLD